ncbi:hypothetical protein [Sulfuriferula plumbiphila]|nr:hypothetical protein [Sulfuriferula plumbiphila]
MPPQTGSSPGTTKTLPGRTAAFLQDTSIDRLFTESDWSNTIRFSFKNWMASGVGALNPAVLSNFQVCCLTYRLTGRGVEVQREVGQTWMCLPLVPVDA